MSNITNPEAVKFCNEKVRALADAATAYYYVALAAVNEWNANSLGTVIPYTADTIVDGSETDGRTPITGAKVNGLIDHVEAMIVDLEANSNQKLNVLLQIEVNGSP